MFSVFDTLKIWMDAGAPAEKLLMGFAQYGRGMTLNFTDQNGLYCPAYDGRSIRKCQNIRYYMILWISTYLTDKYIIISVCFKVSLLDLTRVKMVSGVT